MSSWREALVDALARRLTGTVSRFADMEPAARRRATMVLDGALCLVATWLAFALRLGLVYLPLAPFFIVLGSAAACWAAITYRLGLYRSMLRYSGARTMFDLVWAAGIMGVAMSTFFVIARFDGLPRTVGVLQPMIFVGLVGTSRLLVRFALVDFAPRSGAGGDRSVLIYGAGRAGQQLALSLRHERHVRVIGYLDDDRRLHGQRLDGKPVYDPEQIGTIARQVVVDEVLLALPSASRGRRREIVEALQAHGVAVRSLPSTAKIIAGEVSFSDLREVLIEDLLGRDPVPPNELLLGRNICDKVVLVTGAGGSIGGELCRQILRSHPRRLVLVEHSEFALYAIEAELRSDPALGDCTIVTELCNVADEAMVSRVFARARPDTVFHSAAYKHVPLVEENPISGVFNNVFGTLACCLAAEAVGVSTFILISTDKAVRPTNVMGATKRVCELILQARAQLVGQTTFTMVRFGNVLGSSGSVIPKFREQIAAGGPVTVTDREVTRYFMTIPEAAQLVIQAGAMARGGDVFVLDMGDPVRIVDLATTLIRLSGRSVRDAENPAGDIEIVEIGLRNGEKRYEELLIGNDPQPTQHPRIVKAHEACHDWPVLGPKLEAMRAVALAGDGDAIIAQLRELVPDFVRAVHSGPQAVAG